MLMDKNSDNIQVLVRVRPLNSRELQEDARTCIIFDEYRPNCVMLDAKPEIKVFNFDWVGCEKTTQQEIFEVIGKPMVQTCLEGYNCCIFAYGQTGAGKTYTMQGRGLDSDVDDIKDRGLQPRVFDHIFSIKAKDMQENPDTKYLISCTYLEIYNEQIKDLLEPVNATLQIREDLKKGVYVEGLKDEGVDNSEETIELLRKGAMNRHVGSTNMNAESSRSHSLFTMTIERKKAMNGTIHVRTSKFHFVDLAGSERQKQTAAAGERLKEAGNINKSLSVLGQVINSLVEIAEGKQRHIRYRDSKLTFILKDSLGGNSKTGLIANISPASSSFAETLSTLKFAQRAKQIKNKASINEDSTGSVEGLKNEIRQLKEELAQSKRLLQAFEGDQRRLPKSPKLTPHALMMGMGMDNQKTIMEQNQRSLETERLLKETMEVLTENEFLLQAELAKKEEYINTFKSAVEMYNSNELQYRTVIQLNQARLERMVNVLYDKASELNLAHMFDEENGQLKREVAALLELVNNTPAIMKTFMDNVEMRERIDTLEAEINPNSSVSVARQLQENLIFLQELTYKLDENIRERKALSEKFEHLGQPRGSSGSPEAQKKLEDEIRQLKMEHNHQLDKYNFEILDLRRKEEEARRAAEIENKRYLDVLREYEGLKDLKQRNEEKYEKKINELYQEFERIQNTRVNMDGLEKTIDQLNLKNLELKEQMLSYKEKYEDIVQLYHEMEECIKNTLNEKEEAENMFRNELSKTNVEKGVLENTVASLENRMNLILEDLNKSKNELNELTQTLSELYSKENDYKLSLDTLYQENIQLQERYIKLEDEKSSEIIQLQSALEKQKVRAEALDTERTKLQEELDTLNQTFNYNLDELEEKKRLLSEAHSRLTEYERTYSNLFNEKTRQQEYIVLLEKQIFEHNQENSPANLAIKENSVLKEQIIQLKNDIRGLEIEAQQKKAELEEANSRILELNESVQKYSAAYKETYSKLEGKSNELKDVYTALDSKLSELNELEQELKASNDNILKREGEIVELKNQIYRLNDTVNRLEAGVQRLEMQKQQLQADLEFKHSENVMLNERVSESSKKVAELESQINELKLAQINELEEITNSLIILKATCDNKSLEVQNLTAELRETEEKAKLFEERLVNLNKATQQLQEEKTNFEAEAIGKIQELQKAILTKDQHLETLKNQLDKSLRTTNSLEGEIATKEETLRSKEKILQESVKKIKELEEKLAYDAEALRVFHTEIESRDKKLKDMHNKLNEKIAESQSHLAKAIELENARAEKDEMLASLSRQVEEKFQEVKDLENKMYLKEESFKNLKMEMENSLKRVSELECAISVKEEELAKLNLQKIPELEKILFVREKEIIGYKKEAETREQRIAELDREIAGKREELATYGAKINEYAKKMSQMEVLMQEEQQNYSNTMNSLQKELEKLQLKSAEEKRSLMESFAPKEQAYQQQTEQLTRELNIALQGLSGETARVKELQEKMQITEKEIEEKDAQIKEYIDEMLQMKTQLDGYIDVINQLGELTKIREENTRLKGELKKQKDLISRLNLQAAEHFKQQEEEINRIKESYSKLENQHQFIMATASIKDSEAAKSREEIRLMLTEKDKLLCEIKRLKESEVQLKKLKEESDEEVKRVTNEKLALMVQLDNLDKANSQLAGHNNFKQKVEHLTKVKEENTKLRDEKMRLQERLNKAQEKVEQLQKKLDDLAKKRNIDPTKLDSELNEAQYMQIELDVTLKIKIENRLLYDAATKINQLLNVNFYYRKNTPFTHTSKDLNKTLDGVQELINVLMDKEKEIREREREIEGKRLHYNIIERELAVIKQKYQLTLANTDPEVSNLRENKENLDFNTEKQFNKKSEMKTEKVGSAQPSSGGKRPLDDIMIPANINKVKSPMEKYERKQLTEMIRANKEKREKEGKLSFGKLHKGQEPQLDSPEFMKNISTIVDDITNQDLEGESLRKKVKGGPK